jgi:hypothetical protein
MKCATGNWKTHLFLLIAFASCSGCGGNSSAGPTATSASPAVTQTPFLLYDNTYYPNSSTVFDSAGTLRAAVLYGQTAWPGTCTSTGCPNAPTQAQFQSTLQTYVKEFGSSNAIIFDYEGLDISQETSAAAANNAVALFLQMIAWTRAIYPNAKIGMYDYDWSGNYTPNSSTGFNAIRASLFKGGASSFDFFVPTMYQRWASHAIWDQNLTQAIIDDSAVNKANGQSLPIYSYISPYVSGVTPGTLLTDSEWQSELADVMSCNTPLSSSCQAVMANVTAVSGECSATGSTSLCSATGGAILWVGTSSTNVDPTASWVQDALATLSPTVSPHVIYQIASQSGLCVDSNAGIPSANACSTQTSQEWMFTPVGSTGFYSVSSYNYQQANPIGTNQIWDGSTGSLALALLASGGATVGQQWQVVSLANGNYEFVKLADYATSGNTDSEECLTTGAVGQLLTTAVCNLGANQVFKLTAE